MYLAGKATFEIFPYIRDTVDGGEQFFLNDIALDQCFPEKEWSLVRMSENWLMTIFKSD